MTKDVASAKTSACDGCGFDSRLGRTDQSTKKMRSCFSPSGARWRLGFSSGLGVSLASFLSTGWTCSRGSVSAANGGVDTKKVFFSVVVVVCTTSSRLRCFFQNFSSVTKHRALFSDFERHSATQRLIGRLVALCSVHGVTHTSLPRWSASDRVLQQWV